MDVECFVRLSRKQQRDLPRDYVPPTIEGMYSIDNEHPEGIIYIYVGYCDWVNNFRFCVREFVLTVFHEAMHIMFPELEEHIPYAEKVLAEILITEFPSNQLSSHASGRHVLNHVDFVCVHRNSIRPGRIRRVK